MPGWLELRPGWLGLRPGWLGLRPGWLGLRLGWLGLRPGWLGLRPGWMALRGGQTDKRTNKQTNVQKISPFYRTSSPIKAAALPPPMKIKEKVEQGKETADHFMPLGYLFSCFLSSGPDRGTKSCRMGRFSVNLYIPLRGPRASQPSEMASQPARPKGLPPRPKS